MVGAAPKELAAIVFFCPWWRYVSFGLSCAQVRIQHIFLVELQDSYWREGLKRSMVVAPKP